MGFFITPYRAVYHKKEVISRPNKRPDYEAHT